MKYDILMPEDIKPYLNGRSWKDLKVGDEIAFPELDDTLTPESLVGRRIKVRWNKKKAYDGTIEGFDASTGKHQVTYEDGDKKSYDFKGDRLLRNSMSVTRRWRYEGGDGGTFSISRMFLKERNRFVIEGAEAYLDWRRGACIIRKSKGGVNVNARAN